MKPKFLIADDSSSARRKLRQIIEELGFSVEEASNGEQALERFYISPPALVFLDLLMTGISSLPVLTKIREMDPAARVIVATADTHGDTLKRARTVGAKWLLYKPYQKERIVAAIDCVLGGGDLWNLPSDYHGER